MTRVLEAPHRNGVIFTPAAGVIIFGVGGGTEHDACQLWQPSSGSRQWRPWPQLPPRSSLFEAGLARWHRRGSRTQLKDRCFSFTLLCAVDESVARMWPGVPSSGHAEIRASW